MSSGLVNPCVISLLDFWAAQNPKFPLLVEGTARPDEEKLLGPALAKKEAEIQAIQEKHVKEIQTLQQSYDELQEECQQIIAQTSEKLKIEKAQEQKALEEKFTLAQNETEKKIADLKEKFESEKLAWEQEKNELLKIHNQEVGKWKAQNEQDQGKIQELTDESARWLQEDELLKQQISNLEERLQQETKNSAYFERQVEFEKSQRQAVNEKIKLEQSRWDQEKVSFMDELKRRQQENEILKTKNEDLLLKSSQGSQLQEDFNLIQSEYQQEIKLAKETLEVKEKENSELKKEIENLQIRNQKIILEKNEQDEKIQQLETRNEQQRLENLNQSGQIVILKEKLEQQGLNLEEKSDLLIYQTEYCKKKDEKVLSLQTQLEQQKVEYQKLQMQFNEILHSYETKKKEWVRIQESLEQKSSPVTEIQTESSKDCEAQAQALYDRYQKQNNELQRLKKEKEENEAFSGKREEIVQEVEDCQQKNQELLNENVECSIKEQNVLAENKKLKKLVEKCAEKNKGSASLVSFSSKSQDSDDDEDENQEVVQTDADLYQVRIKILDLIISHWKTLFESIMNLLTALTQFIMMKSESNSKQTDILAFYNLPDNLRTIQKTADEIRAIKSSLQRESKLISTEDQNDEVSIVTSALQTVKQTTKNLTPLNQITLVLKQGTNPLRDISSKVRCFESYLGVLKKDDREIQNCREKRVRAKNSLDFYLSTDGDTAKSKNKKFIETIKWMEKFAQPTKSCASSNIVEVASAWSVL